MRFFTPRKKFFPWIKGLQSRLKLPVVDRGCGEGDLVVEMRDHGVPALGLDMFADPMHSKEPLRVGFILEQIAQHSTFVVTVPSLLLCCRPCHSGFPASINNARKTGSAFYYIGFEQNIEFDLGGADTEMVVKGIGKEGEDAWQVTGKSKLLPIDFFMDTMLRRPLSMEA